MNKSKENTIVVSTLKEPIKKETTSTVSRFWPFLEFFHVVLQFITLGLQIALSSG